MYLGSRKGRRGGCTIHNDLSYETVGKSSIDGTFKRLDVDDITMNSASLSESLKRTLEIFADADEPLTTTEVAAQLDIGRRSTYSRLDRLVEADQLRTKKVGANARVWWRPRRQGVGVTKSLKDASIIRAIEDYAIFTLDHNGHILTWNPGASRIKGYSDDEIIGEHFEVFYTEEDQEREKPRVNLTIASEEGSLQEYGWRVRKDGSKFWANVSIAAIYDENGEVRAFAKVVQDVSDRHERERQLQSLSARIERERDQLQYELDEVFDRISDGFYALDEAFRFRYLNEHAKDILSVDETVIGVDFREVVTMTSAFEERLHEAHASNEPIVFEDYYDPVDRWFYNAIYPSESGLSVYFRDITESKRRERELTRFKNAVEASGHAIYMMDDERTITFANGAFETITGYDQAETVGATPGGLLSTSDQDIFDGDLPQLIGERGTVDVEFTATRKDGGDIHLEQTIAPVFDQRGEIDRFVAVLRDISDRIDRERTLKRQREQLAALNSINEVVLSISDAVIDQSTREEIEHVACETLASSDHFAFAWVGEPDTASLTVLPRTQVGAGDYLDDIEISIDPDDPRSAGPTGRAYLTGEIQTAHDIHKQRAHDPWRERAREHGLRSSAAIPITHEDIVYGVLNVYSTRENAFRGYEMRVGEDIGRIIGHAIASAERKRALMSDELLELKFVIHDVFSILDRPIKGLGTITIDFAVPISGDEFLVYGTATADAADNLYDLVEAVPFWKSFDFLTEGDPCSFQLRTHSPPVLTTVSNLGGSIDETVIEDGECRISVHLPPGADTHRILDAVEATYPDADLLHSKYITRHQDGIMQMHDILAEGVTDRQRVALDAAYHAGYFDWPRGASAEDVAASLDIAPATFHQHLRKAERKVLDALYGD